MIYIICFLAFSCNHKQLATIDRKISKTDTVFYTRNLRPQTIHQKINHSFDSTKVKPLLDSRPFMQFSNNVTKDLNSFLNKMFLIDDSLDKIIIQNDSINFYKHIAGDSSYWVFNHYMYHDIYNSLFTFPEIDKIKVFLEYNQNKSSNSIQKNQKTVTNITYLPLSGDYEILLPHGIMKKKWYLKNTDYWDVFSGNLLDTPNTFIDKNLTELKEQTIDSVINNFSSTKTPASN